jgi:hypothetical protein
MPYDRAIVSKLSSLALDSKHKIIVGVDYGTTFTGTILLLQFASTEEITNKGAQRSELRELQRKRFKRYHTYQHLARTLEGYRDRLQGAVPGCISH